MDLQAAMALVMTLLLHVVLVVWLCRPHVPKPGPSVNGAMRMHLLRLTFRRDKPVKIVINQAVVPVTTRQAKNPRKPTAPMNAVAGIPSSEVANPPKGSPELQLFNPDGSIRMAPTVLKLRATGEVDMRHFQQLPCRGTRWSDTAERGQNETPGEEIARKYLSVVGLYNKETEAAYQRRRVWLDQACPH